MISDSLDLIENFRGLNCTVDVDKLFDYRLKLFLLYDEINFKRKEILRLASVNISQILRKDLVEQESAKC